MQVYDVGPNSLSEYDFGDINQNDYVWMVVEYECGSYEGDGTATALGKDGKLYHFGLGHCSCYGPLDGCKVTAEEVETYLERFEDVTEQVASDKVHTKVMELLGK